MMIVDSSDTTGLLLATACLTSSETSSDEMFLEALLIELAHSAGLRSIILRLERGMLVVGRKSLGSGGVLSTCDKSRIFASCTRLPQKDVHRRRYKSRRTWERVGVNNYTTTEEDLITLSVVSSIDIDGIL